MAATTASALGTDQASRTAVSVPAPTPASSMRDAGQIVSGFVDYIGALKDASDVSIDRLQSAAGIRLRQGRSGIGYRSPVSAEGDWITLRFSDGGKATGRSVILQFEHDQAADESSAHCRLSFNSLRDNLLRQRYVENRDLGAQGEVVVWLLLKDAIRVEVGTRATNANASDRMCVQTIKAIG
jgi:hypothetical protein